MNTKILISRIDPMGGIPDPNLHGTELSSEIVGSWDDVIAILRRHGVNDLTAPQLAEFHAQSPAETITFQHREFVNQAGAAWLCNVHYILDVQPVSAEGVDSTASVSDAELWVTLNQPCANPYQRGVGQGFGPTEDGD